MGVDEVKRVAHDVDNVTYLSINEEDWIGEWVSAFGKGNIQSPRNVGTWIR